MSSFKCDRCGKLNIDSPDGYIDECDCYKDKPMNKDYKQKNCPACCPGFEDSRCGYCGAFLPGTKNNWNNIKDIRDCYPINTFSEETQKEIIALFKEEIKRALEEVQVEDRKPRTFSEAEADFCRGFNARGELIKKNIDNFLK